MAQVLQLSPRFKRGIGHFQNVQGSPQFISLSEIIYVAGQHLVIEHVESKLQLRFIALPHHGSSLLCVSLIKGQYAAISFSNENPCIGLWNLKESSDKVEMIHVGTDVQCMCFSCDGKYIVYVVKESDHPKVAIWDIELRKNGKNPYSLNDVGSNVYLISANPIEALCFALGGLELLRIVNYSELSESWESMDYNLSPDLAVLSLVWLNYNTLLVGSNDGTLLVADSKQIKARYEALTLDNLDISLKRNPHMSTNVKQRQHCFRHVDLKWSPCYVAISDHAVLSIATYHEGFALVCLPNFIILMKQGSENK
ncbi:hypothetical protein M8J76_009248 [Diaphorina citri]|nr:hypothetical protein M8J76_009248 [Diaphorina citri]